VGTLRTKGGASGNACPLNEIEHNFSGIHESDDRQVENCETIKISLIKILG
jgi:hypothetical protein